MTASEAWRPAGPRFVLLGTLPFIAVALFAGVRAAQYWSLDLATDPIRWVWDSIVPWLPQVALPLIGAALIVRHPRARQHQPWLLLGAILLAFQVLGETLPVRGELLRLFPSSDMRFGPSVVATFYELAVSIVGSLGLLSLARGLHQARGQVRSGVGRVLFGVVAVAAVGGAGYVYAGWTADPAPFITLALGATASTALGLLAIGSLGVIAARGWADGEAPSRGWAMAAIAPWLIFLAIVLNIVLALGAAAAMTGGMLTVAFFVIGGLPSIAAVLLLAAFVIGLPASEDIRWYDLDGIDDAASAEPEPVAT